jgi:hypothetical protein
MKYILTLAFTICSLCLFAQGKSGITKDSYQKNAIKSAEFIIKTFEIKESSKKDSLLTIQKDFFGAVVLLNSKSYKANERAVLLKKIIADNNEALQRVLTRQQYQSLTNMKAKLSEKSKNRERTSK